SDQADIVWDKLEEVDLFNRNEMVGLKRATPAEIRQKTRMEIRMLEEDDKDMSVMYHKFSYKLNGNMHQMESTMVSLSEDQTYMAMAKTLGLPVAIATLAILNEKITTPGVQIPITKEVYGPILKELEEFDIIFTEKEVPYLGYNPLNV